MCEKQFRVEKKLKLSRLAKQRALLFLFVGSSFFSIGNLSWAGKVSVRNAEGQKITYKSGILGTYSRYKNRKKDPDAFHEAKAQYHDQKAKAARAKIGGSSSSSHEEDLSHDEGSSHQGKDERSATHEKTAKEHETSESAEGSAAKPELKKELARKEPHIEEPKKEEASESEHSPSHKSVVKESEASEGIEKSESANKMEQSLVAAKLKLKKSPGTPQSTGEAAQEAQSSGAFATSESANKMEQSLVAAKLKLKKSPGTPQSTGEAAQESASSGALETSESANRMEQNLAAAKLNLRKTPNAGEADESVSTDVSAKIPQAPAVGTTDPSQKTTGGNKVKWVQTADGGWARTDKVTPYSGPDPVPAKLSLNPEAAKRLNSATSGGGVDP